MGEGQKCDRVDAKRKALRAPGYLASGWLSERGRTKRAHRGLSVRSAADLVRAPVDRAALRLGPAQCIRLGVGTGVCVMRISTVAGNPLPGAVIALMQQSSTMHTAFVALNDYDTSSADFLKFRVLRVRE